MTPAPGAGQEQGPRGGGRGWGGGGGMMGRGMVGTVTEIAADHFTIKNDAGETWTIHFSANTRVMKMTARPAGQAPGAGAGQANAGAQGQEPGRGSGGGRGMGMGGPPTAIKASDIKVGDAITAGGEVDQASKSVGAIMIVQLDPETAKRMAEMRANYGKTWLGGRVTAINDTTVTIQGSVDGKPHTFVADENTTFRRRREPITLGDIQVGDNVRVEGTVKGGQFVAAAVSAMAPMAVGGPERRPGPPPQ